MKAPQLNTHHSQPHQQPNHINNYQQGYSQAKGNHPQIIHNSFANQSQNLYNQYHHNPYVGYVPHYASNQAPGYSGMGFNPQMMNGQVNGGQGVMHNQMHVNNHMNSQMGNRPMSYQPTGSIQGFTLNS